MADEDHLNEFLAADALERRRLASDPMYEDAVRELVGEKGLAQLLSLPSADEDHLAAKPNPNLVFVPGIMGSQLRPEGLAGTWWLSLRARDHLNDLALTADGLNDAFHQYSNIQPAGVDLSYQEFLMATLVHPTLSNRTFAFDWRKTFEASVDELVAHVAGVRDENGGDDIHLIGHSMGGLLIRTALQRRPELWNMLGQGRVVYIGTPHFGSISIAGYLKGHFWGTEKLALLGLYVSRETFRTMWGALSLLPAPAGIYPGSESGDHPCANFDIYDPAAYELDLTAEAHQRLATILSYVRDQWSVLTDHHAGLSPDQLDRQLMVAGVGQETLFRLDRDGKWFGLADKKHTKREPGKPHREGDGRVPLASAELPGLRTVYVKGEHGSLQNMPGVAAAAFEFAANGKLPKSGVYRTVAEALASHLSMDEPLAAPALTSSPQDGGYFNPSTILDDMSEAERNRLRHLAESDHIPGFALTKIL